MPRVLTFTEGNTEAPDLARVWRSGVVIRPWHAVRDSSMEPGKPQRLLFEEKRGSPDWTWDTEEVEMPPGNGVRSGGFSDHGANR